MQHIYSRKPDFGSEKPYLFLNTAYNSSSRVSDISFWTPWGQVHMHIYSETHAYTNKLKSKSFKKEVN